MPLNKLTIQELGEIMKKNYGIELPQTDLEKFAYALVGYFTLLLKAKVREQNKGKFGNSSASHIDNENQKQENEEAKK